MPATKVLYRPDGSIELVSSSKELHLQHTPAMWKLLVSQGLPAETERDTQRLKEEPDTTKAAQRGEKQEQLPATHTAAVPEKCADLSTAVSQIEEMKTLVEANAIELAQLKHDAQSLRRMLGAHVEQKDILPNLVLLLPNKPKTALEKLGKAISPMKYLMHTYTLHFICSVTGKLAASNRGKGYTIRVEKHTVVKYLPALKLTVLVCHLLSGHMPAVSAMVEEAKQVIDALDSLLDKATLDKLVEKTYGALGKRALAAYEQASLLDRPISGVDANLVQEIRLASLRQIAMQVKKQDPTLARCGLVGPVTSRKDGCVAYVSEEGLPKFHELGEESILQLTPSEK